MGRDVGDMGEMQGREKWGDMDETLLGYWSYDVGRDMGARYGGENSAANMVQSSAANRVQSSAANMVQSSAANIAR